jgi:thiol-disulfide isomerase/thioredoxin
VEDGRLKKLARGTPDIVTAHSMTRFPLLLLLLLAACGSEAPDGQAGNGASAPASVAGLDRRHKGKPAPDVEFQDPDGEPASLADFRGEPLLLNLWATWCAPCVKELPTLDALAARERGRLQVVTLSEDMEGREKVEAFLAKSKFAELESWLDPEMRMMAALGVTTLPATILYDAEGREVWRMVGDEDWTGKEAAALIAEASRP